MSDCFNHSLDAYDSLGYGDNDGRSNYSRKPSESYYKEVSFSRIIKENDKSYFVAIDANYAIEVGFLEETQEDIKRAFEALLTGFNTIAVWIPKKIVRDIDRIDKTMLVHIKTLKDCIKSAFMYHF